MFYLIYYTEHFKSKSCLSRLLFLPLQGFAVKIDDLAIFSIGIRNKEGAASEKEFTIAKNIDGFRLRARGTGEFSAKTINLAATLKKASALLGDGTTPDTTPDTGKDTPGGDNTDQGGSGTHRCHEHGDGNLRCSWRW